MTISRPASIYITEDTWAQLANTLNGNINPFYLNPEERFKNDNNGTDAKLAPIQEDEISEPMHVEETQTTENDLPPNPLPDNTSTAENILSSRPQLAQQYVAVC